MLEEELVINLRKFFILKIILNIFMIENYKDKEKNKTNIHEEQ
jgi:hypothetical protein